MVGSVLVSADDSSVVLLVVDSVSVSTAVVVGDVVIRVVVGVVASVVVSDVVSVVVPVVPAVVVVAALPDSVLTVPLLVVGPEGGT